MKYVRERKMEVGRARDAAHNVKTSVLDAEVTQADWEQYLTLLNLRNWETLQRRPVTEQIYVHSKLLIADDRVVVLGSANINDRSQLGDRDSELAVIVHDDQSASVTLDGKNNHSVGTLAYSFRKALWQKHFGLMGGFAPARTLNACLDQPANRKTWELIQAVARDNAIAYQKPFPFLAKIDRRSSIWPTWGYEQAKLTGYMPFNERFWRSPQPRDNCFTWDAQKLLFERAPIGIQSFIVALPIMWGFNENNDSKMNLTTLANVDMGRNTDREQQTAATGPSRPDQVNV